MTALALHRVRIEPTWSSGPRTGAPGPAPQQGEPRKTPLTVVGGTITPEQAAGIERHLEATKGQRLAAAMAERGSSPSAIDWWFGGAR